jgi:hypothetical protein
MNEAPTLDQLFNKDPLSLLDEEVDLIAARLRANRANWLAEEGVKKEAKRNPTKEAAPADLSITDLEI